MIPRHLTRLILAVFLATWWGGVATTVSAETSLSSFEGDLVRVERSDAAQRGRSLAVLRNVEHQELRVAMTGPGAIFHRLAPGDTVIVHYKSENEGKPVTVDTVQVKRGHIEGTLEQLDRQAFVKIGTSPGDEVLVLPSGPADLTKGLSAGDSVEGIYTQEGFDAPKILQTIGLKRASITTQTAAGVMLIGIGGFLLIAALLLNAGRFLKAERFKLRALVIGADNRTSNSKTQAAIWFGVVISSYLATLLERIWHGGWAYVGGIDIPQNLFILSGISAGTFAGAKLVTANRVASGTSKPEANAASLRDLFANDSGRFDLGDFQMFAWVLLAAGVYLLQMIAFLKTLPLSASVSLPDVDSTLLSFFGIGQGAYLAKKGFGEVQAQVTGIMPAEGRPGSIANISGSGFGKETGHVRFGTAIALVKAWNDTVVQVEVPQGLRSGRLPVQVSLLTEDKSSLTGWREVPLQPVLFTVL